MADLVSVKPLSRVSHFLPRKKTLPSEIPPATTLNFSLFGDHYPGFPHFAINSTRALI